MATYIELIGLSADSTLKQRVTVACVIAANVIATEDPATVNHANRLEWGKRVYANPESMSSQMLWSVLAQNSSLTVAQINSASDAAIQTAVNNAIVSFL